MNGYYTQLDDDRGADALVREREREAEFSRMTNAYDAAKRALVGESTDCPVCRHRFRKTSYQQAFCSNQKKKRNGRNCKDRYHNVTSPRGMFAQPKEDILDF